MTTAIEYALLDGAFNIFTCPAVNKLPIPSGRLCRANRTLEKDAPQASRLSM